MIGKVCGISDKFIWIESSDGKSRYVYEQPKGDTRCFKLRGKVDYVLSDKDKPYMYVSSIEKMN